MNKMTAVRRFRPGLTALTTALLLLVAAGATHAGEPVGSTLRAVQTIAIGRGEVTSGDQVLLGDEYAVGRYGTLTIQFSDESTLILTPGSRARIVSGTEKSPQWDATGPFVIQLNGHYRWIPGKKLSLGRIQYIENSATFTPPGNERQYAPPSPPQPVLPTASQETFAPSAESAASAGNQESLTAAQPGVTEKPEQPPARSVKSKVAPTKPKRPPTAQPVAQAKPKKSPAKAVKSKASPTKPKRPSAAQPVAQTKPKKVPAPAQASSDKRPAADKTVSSGKPTGDSETPDLTTTQPDKTQTPGAVDNSAMQDEAPTTPTDSPRSQEGGTVSDSETNAPLTAPEEKAQPKESTQPAASGI